MSVTFSNASTTTHHEAARYHLLVMPAASVAAMHGKHDEIVARLDARFGHAAALTDASHDAAYDDVLRHLDRVYAQSGARFVMLVIRLPGEARPSYEMYVRPDRAWKYFPTVYARGHHNTLAVDVMSVAEFRHTLHAVRR